MERMDTNGLIAALLRDLAAVQSSRQSQWGYKRAATAVRNLDEPIESFVEPGGLPSHRRRGALQRAEEGVFQAERLGAAAHAQLAPPG